jgi:hypothetical protein
VMHKERLFQNQIKVDLAGKANITST